MAQFRDPEVDEDDDDFVQASDFKKVWDLVIESDVSLLFGARSSSETVDLSTLHPEPVHIFRLWQLYLDDVNPILKVTHTPTMQGRIIEAMSDISNVNPALETLMFAIYSMALLTLTSQIDKCQETFGASPEELLTRYQFGCQQALLNCSFLRGDNRDCLTAMFLYLASRSLNHVETV